jgi:tRNA U38,U39,U40 pseudouridine synthase TruA
MPDREAFLRLQRQAGGLIKLLTIAPELPGAMTFIKEQGESVRMYVTGDGFLYNMVRIIAGTLMAVGMGKIEPDAVAGIIASCDRTKAGQTAEPQGLTLVEIFYE